MMRFELGLEEPDPRRALRSAMTIAGAYIAGGLIPLAPYMAVSSTRDGLLLSIGVTVLALFVFGYIKGHFTGTRPIRSALQTTFIGGIAAAAAFLIAHAILVMGDRPRLHQFPSRLPINPGGLVPGTTTRSPGKTW